MDNPGCWSLALPGQANTKHPLRQVDLYLLFNRFSYRNSYIIYSFFCKYHSHCCIFLLSFFLIRCSIHLLFNIISEYSNYSSIQAFNLLLLYYLRLVFNPQTSSREFIFPYNSKILIHFLQNVGVAP